MKPIYVFVCILMLMCFSFTTEAQQKVNLPPGYQVDTRIDNMGYWRTMAAAGLVPVQPHYRPAPAIPNGSRPTGRGVTVEDSPDVPVTNESSTQSENSIFVDLSDEAHVLNSNNSTSPGAGTLYGANYFHSYDEGETWSGQLQGAGGSNQGDPVALINTTGRYFINFIDNQYGQSVAWSDNDGQSWSVAKISNGSLFNILDKNHMWVDNSQTSPYEGYLYCGWMESNNIYVSRSITNGTTWEGKINISSATSAGSHNQGINFKTGPDGEVYAAWSVYDNWPGDEKAIGFSKSTDGGVTWQPAVRALNNIRGIRTSGVTQNHRVNSFPSMAVDISNSPYRGHIYIVWANIGVPGVNTGSGCDIYMIKSADEGVTWSAPMQINTDAGGSGKTHYFPWIACDMANGTLTIVSYDNRNVASTQAEAWMAWSTDGGDTWEDMKVSDVAFTPAPIPGLASGYMGDYLAIDIYNGKAYPCWGDNRLGYVMTFVSPIDLIPPSSAIVYDNYILNDTTYGNGNGLMDYGEDILLGLRLVNDGNMEADSVTVFLSSVSPYVDMIDSVEFYGDFNVDQKKTILNAYRFTVSNEIPDNEWIPFTVKAVDARDSVTYSNFMIWSHAPNVTIVSMVLLDASGNNNGILDPGESGVIRIETSNNGDYTAEDVVSHLTSANPYVVIQEPVYTIGDMQPGATVYATFPVTANEAAANGSAALLHNLATSLYRDTERYFTLDIGINVEDWETGNFQKFPWQFAGDANWMIDPAVKYEGNYAAKSGVIGDNQSSVLEIGYHVMLDDSITFWRKVSSKPLSDYLKFYIDGMQVGQWFGNQDWKRMAYPVLAGPHTFRWEYVKDGTGTSGDDCAWIDFIVFPPEYRTTVSAGPDGEICVPWIYQLRGLALNYDSLAWSTSGTGTFDDPTILEPNYTPSAGDVASGSVILTLTGFGTGLADTTDSMVLTFSQSATASSGGTGAVCHGAGFTPAGATASGYSNLMWTTAGDGVFDDPTQLHPTYTPGPQDWTNHGATLTLTAGSGNLCPPVSDPLTLVIHDLPVVNLGKDTAICAGLSYTFDANTPGAVSWLWSPGGETTPTLTVDSSGTGIGSREYSVLVTDVNGCQGTDAATVTFKVCGGIGELPGARINVYPNPSTGQFTVELHTASPLQVDLRIISATGEIVYKAAGIEVDGQYTRTFSLDHPAAGTYLVEIAAGNYRMVRPLVIQQK